MEVYYIFNFFNCQSMECLPKLEFFYHFGGKIIGQTKFNFKGEHN